MGDVPFFTGYGKTRDVLLSYPGFSPSSVSDPSLPGFLVCLPGPLRKSLGLQAPLARSVLPAQGGWAVNEGSSWDQKPHFHQDLFYFLSYNDFSPLRAYLPPRGQRAKVHTQVSK